MYIDVATLEDLKKVDKKQANKSEPVEEIAEYQRIAKEVISNIYPLK